MPTAKSLRPLYAALFLSLPLLAAPAAPAPDPACDRVRFYPAPDAEAALPGGRFEGSNTSRREGFELLTTIKETPAPKAWTELTFPNTKVFRWLRYVGPAGSHGRIAEVEFYAGDRKLSGKGNAYGQVVRDASHSWQQAFDGKPDSWFESQDPDGAFVGIDLRDLATARYPQFTPAAPPAPMPSAAPALIEYDAPLQVTIKSTTPGAVIRYTLDGTWPDLVRGIPQRIPINVNATQTVQAVAYQEGRAASPPVATTYLIKGSAKSGFSTFHWGNSLTQTTGQLSAFIRTAGFAHQSAIFARPGAWTKELWETGLTQEKDRAMALWNTLDHVDHVTVQPRDFNLDEEAGYDIHFFDMARQKSPGVQPWLYCEWTEMKRERPTDKGLVPSSQMSRLFPALTWEESMSAMMLYVEELQLKVCAKYKEGNRPRVLPSALMMGWMRNLIDHGQIPGIAPGTFYQTLFNDQVHPTGSPMVAENANGGYLVDLTWFSAFYGLSPEKRILPIATTYTPEANSIIQKLAWDVIRNYPDAGLYEEGTKPCAKPEFTSDNKTITLHSGTPGAWFRYTLDGTTPTRTRGYIYCGVISVQPGIHVKAVAYESGMADSPVADLPPAPGPLAGALQHLVDKHLLSGAVVLVANRDRVLDLEPTGYASLERKTPMTDDSLFWIASMTKSFTATALMMLVDEGKVHVQDPVEKYLPEFKGELVAGENGQPPHPPKHPITIAEILSHTSGLIRASDKSLKPKPTLKEEIEQVAAAPLRQEPGTKYEYNNNGINTAGRIIEVVSGLPYADFLQQRLLTPLKMTHTTFWPTEAEATHLVTTSRHSPDGQSLEDIHQDAGFDAATLERFEKTSHVPRPMLANFGGSAVSWYDHHYAMPAGGLYSTAADIGRFCQMLLNGGTFEGHRYLTPAALTEMTTSHTRDAWNNPTEAYGLGLTLLTKLEDALPAGTFGHLGARRTAMWIDPADHLAFVILLSRMDMTGQEQRQAYGAFYQAALAKFAPEHK
jgi:CubicO group peptidase (beta-lactamase class C family)